MRQLLGLLLLIGFVSCSTLNTALLSSPKKAEPTLATEPTVTIEPTKLPKDDQTPVGTTGGPSTTGFPSSTTLKTTTKPTPPPLNFEDELIVSQAPIEPMLPTANCKVKPLLNSSSFAEVVPPILKTITSSSFPTSGILSDVKKNSVSFFVLVLKSNSNFFLFSSPLFCFFHVLFLSLFAVLFCFLLFTL